METAEKEIGKLLFLCLALRPIGVMFEAFTLACYAEFCRNDKVRYFPMIVETLMKYFLKILADH